MNKQRTTRLDALNLSDLYSLQLPGTSVKYSFCFMSPPNEQPCKNLNEFEYILQEQEETFPRCFKTLKLCRKTCS